MLPSKRIFEITDGTLCNCVGETYEFEQFDLNNPINFRSRNKKVKSNDQVDRIEIYEKTVEVLSPHINKLMQLMKFQVGFSKSLIDSIKRV